MDFEKIVVAPQIVIYKNIFKNSDGLIKCLTEENKNSLYEPWEKWYDNGYRKGFLFFPDQDLENTEEIIYAKEFYEILKFIRKDYFFDFEKNGIWPSFIKDWNKVKAEPRGYFISFFRYDINKAEMRNNTNNLFMDYHVDEFLIQNEIKSVKFVATINVYLNDEYEGGEICAYDSISNKSYVYKPKAGDAVIMPSTSPFYHGVKNFYNNDRYFMRSFFTYETDGKPLTYGEIEKQKDEHVKNNLQLIIANPNEVVIN